MDTILFERSPKFNPGEWEPVDHETLLRECTDEQITMMLLYVATVRTPQYLYRKVVPAVIKDWAKS